MIRWSSVPFLGIIMIMAMPGQSLAQARTWAFSKDTVYEWATNGDSLSLANIGADTLKFDSIGMELVRPVAASFFEAEFFLQATQSLSYLLRSEQGKISYYSNRPNKLVVAPGQVGKGSQFRVEDQFVRLAKSSAITQGDTLLVRLIFMASAGRGRDTLMLKGKQQLPPYVGLRLKQDILRQPLADDRFFDLRGRRLEKMPEGWKVPWAPLVSPGD